MISTELNQLDLVKLTGAGPLQHPNLVAENLPEIPGSVGGTDIHTSREALR